jgi:hypothetical protein
MSGPFYDPFKGKGQIVAQYPDKVIWMTDRDGDIIYCTQQLVQPILDDNHEALNNSAGQRWGDGKIVASIPLPEYFEKFVPARQAGDEKYIKKLLNDSDFSKFRRFGGKV